MAHTCGACGTPVLTIVAPTIDGYEVLDNKFKDARRINSNYAHDYKCWKRNAKVRKQWARHLSRIA